MDMSASLLLRPFGEANGTIEAPCNCCCGDEAVQAANTIIGSTFTYEWGYAALTEQSSAPDVENLDLLDLSHTLNASVGGNLSAAVPTNANANLKLVFRYPLTESNKTTWFNTPFNNGQIPDSVFFSVIATSHFKYIVARVNIITFDSSSPLIIS